jgi:Mg/Co/Ni transporter MgtE
MEPEDKEEVEEMLEFRDDTAGGLMDTGSFSLPETATVADAMVGLKESDQIPEDIYSIFLVNANNHLVGTVPLAKLFFAAGDTSLKELSADPLLFVEANEKQDRVAEMFDKYNLLALPVVDEQKELIGVIKVDDVVTILRQR